MHWYYMEAEEKKGPVDFNAMKELVSSGIVAPGVLVWRSGFDSWKPAEGISGLLRSSALTPAPLTSEGTKYEGLGGWLVLVCIGLIVTPLRLVVLVIKDLLPVMSGETWQILTTPGSEVYHPLWAPLLWFELVGNLGFAAASLVLLLFYFEKKRAFPRLMIAFYLTNLAFIAVDAVFGNMIPFVAAQSDPAATREIVRSVIATLIWVPYFLVSKRVKATFTR